MDFWMIALVLAIVIVAFIFGLTEGHEMGYKQGQIDALSGEIYYHQVPDWQYCEGGCE